MGRRARLQVGRPAERSLQHPSEDGVVGCRRVRRMVGEVDKFWTGYEGGGFVDGVSMEYERKKSKMIPRL